MKRLGIRVISRQLVKASIIAAMLLFLPLASLTATAQAAPANPAISPIPAGSDPQLAQIHRPGQQRQTNDWGYCPGAGRSAEHGGKF